MENNTEKPKSDFKLESYFKEKFDITSKRQGRNSRSKNEVEDFQFKWTIQLKLMGLVSLIFIVTTAAIITFASIFFRRDARLRIEEHNIKLTELIGLTIQEQLNLTVLKAKQMAITIEQDFKTEEQKKLFTKLFFDTDSDIVFLGIYSSEGVTDFKYLNAVYNLEYLKEKNLAEIDFQNLIRFNSDKFKEVLNDRLVIQNLSTGQKFPVIGIAIPYTRDLLKHNVIIAILKLDKILKAFETRGITETFMVNEEGRILAHPDLHKILSVEDMSKLPIVIEMFKSGSGNGQIRFKGEDRRDYIGNFKKVKVGNTGIIATVREDLVFSEVYNIQRRNILIVIIALCVAIGGVFFIAKRISNPILKLLDATIEIGKGNFVVNIKPETHDEVGLLTENFIQMSKGLKEREKIKDALGRFVNPAIAELVTTNELKLGGDNKLCTIFFSDIRGFTAMSEKLSPEQVVEFLNEYMTIMVDCIDLTFGIVDKFIGDAIMATWGAIGSLGNPAENGVNAALMMRNVLIDFNFKRKKEGKPAVKMGCGLNYGPVVAGQIGSLNRLEYTVIGDAVNLASRIESLNKPFGTDILISSDLYAEVEGIFIVEKMKEITVKGKSEPQVIYAVIGRYDDPDPSSPKTLAEVRTLVGIDYDTKKFQKFNPNEEEKKYEIK